MYGNPSDDDSRQVHHCSCLQRNESVTSSNGHDNPDSPPVRCGGYGGPSGSGVRRQPGGAVLDAGHRHVVGGKEADRLDEFRQGTRIPQTGSNDADGVEPRPAVPPDRRVHLPPQQRQDLFPVVRPQELRYFEQRVHEGGQHGGWRRSGRRGRRTPRLGPAENETLVAERVAVPEVCGRLPGEPARPQLGEPFPQRVHEPIRLPEPVRGAGFQQSQYLPAEQSGAPDAQVGSGLAETSGEQHVLCPAGDRIARGKGLVAGRAHRLRAFVQLARVDDPQLPVERRNEVGGERGEHGIEVERTGIGGGGIGVVEPPVTAGVDVAVAAPDHVEGGFASGRQLAQQHVPDGRAVGGPQDDARRDGVRTGIGRQHQGHLLRWYPPGYEPAGEPDGVVNRPDQAPLASSRVPVDADTDHVDIAGTTVEAHGSLRHRLRDGQRGGLVRRQRPALDQLHRPPLHKLDPRPRSDARVALNSSVPSASSIGSRRTASDRRIDRQSPARHVLRAAFGHQPVPAVSGYRASRRTVVSRRWAWPVSQRRGSASTRAAVQRDLVSAGLVIRSSVGVAGHERSAQAGHRGCAHVDGPLAVAVGVPVALSIEGISGGRRQVFQNALQDSQRQGPTDAVAARGESGSWAGPTDLGHLLPLRQPTAPSQSTAPP